MSSIQDRIVEFLDGPFKELTEGKKPPTIKKLSKDMKNFVNRKKKGKYQSEASGDKEAYQKFFATVLAKYKVKSAEELSDADKKKFYDEVDAGWEGDNESD